MVAIFFQYTNPDKTTNWIMTFVMGGALLAFTIILLFVSHVSLRQIFGSLKSLWFVVIFLLIINCIIPPKGATMIAFSIKDFNVYWEAIFQSLKIILRLVLMLSLTMILTASTKPLDLTYALEWFMTPLKLVKFPAHEIAMTISIALRFIPTLLDETERIMKAQASRGVDFNHGGIFKRFGAIIALIIPLFVSALERSEELANAMIVRGYDPRAKRTRYRLLRFSWRDIIAFLFIGGIFAGIIVMFVFDRKNPIDLIQLIFNKPGF
jgi:energy-coupling factor transport system permease protein